VYLPLLRSLTPPVLEVFDAAEQAMVTGSRDATTVAPQALYLLNDPFVRQQSLALARRVLGNKSLDDAGRVDAAYRLALGRPAKAKELGRFKKYWADSEGPARKWARPAPASDPKTAAWSSFCQALLGSAEFRYLR